MHVESPRFTVPLPPEPIPLLRVAGLTPWIDHLSRSGTPVGPLLTRSNLPLRIFDQPEILIPVSQAITFMEDAALATGCEDLGLRVGAETPIGALGVFGALVGTAETLRAALDALVRFAPCFDSGHQWWITRRGERVWLSRTLTGSWGSRRQDEQYWTGIALGLLSAVAGHGWQPHEIRLQASATRGFERMGVVPTAPVAFLQAETAIGFAADLLARPLPRHLAARRLDREDVERWQASGPAVDFLESIEQVVSTLSSPQYPRIDVVARAIGAGVRTLQRRLAGAGATYEGVLARSRLGLATRLLTGTNASVLDIALDLGYSDHAHFTRAFRRWTGVPPREYRKRRVRTDRR